MKVWGVELDNAHYFIFLFILTVILPVTVWMFIGMYILGNSKFFIF